MGSAPLARASPRPKCVRRAAWPPTRSRVASRRSSRLGCSASSVFRLPLTADNNESFPSLSVHTCCFLVLLFHVGDVGVRGASGLTVPTPDEVRVPGKKYRAATSILSSFVSPDATYPSHGLNAGVDPPRTTWPDDRENEIHHGSSSSSEAFLRTQASCPKVVDDEYGSAYVHIPDVLGGGFCFRLGVKPAAADDDDNRRRDDENRRRHYYTREDARFLCRADTGFSGESDLLALSTSAAVPDDDDDEGASLKVAEWKRKLVAGLRPTVPVGAWIDGDVTPGGEFVTSVDGVAFQKLSELGLNRSTGASDDDFGKNKLRRHGCLALKIDRPPSGDFVDDSSDARFEIVDDCLGVVLPAYVCMARASTSAAPTVVEDVRVGGGGDENKQEALFVKYRPSGGGDDDKSRVPITTYAQLLESSFSHHVDNDGSGPPRRRPRRQTILSSLLGGVRQDDGGALTTFPFGRTFRDLCFVAGTVNSVGRVARFLGWRLPVGYAAGEATSTLGDTRFRRAAGGGGHRYRRRNQPFPNLRN